MSLQEQFTHTERANGLDAQLDFRTFVDLLRQDNDLAVIDREVDPYLEVGAIIRKVSETDSKAPLFNNVKGTQNGLWRIFGNAASLRKGDGNEKFGRLARNLGLPTNSSWQQFTARILEAKSKPPLKPKIVPTGPCKQNKLFGDAIDLRKLPAPYLHEGDAGKYVQTYGVHILETPDKSWINWSIFRGMIHDSKHLVCLVGSRQHCSVVREQWREKGAKEVPWALALGVPPALTMMAAIPVPEGISESDYVGAMVGKPLDLVKCELSDLMVPANSEIVFEGVSLLDENGPEGPFGDYMAHVFDDEAVQMPLFRVDAITFRNDAILPVSVPGKITDESHTTAVLAVPEILYICQKQGYPIKAAFAPLETLATWCVLQVDEAKLRELSTRSHAFCTGLGEFMFRQKCTMLVNRIVVVGEDVDIYNFQDVIWAYVTRCRPGTTEYFFDNVPSLPITPYMSHGANDHARGGKVVSDALLPIQYVVKPNFARVDFETSYPDSVKQKVERNWRAMGFGD